MARFIVRRLFAMILVLFAVSVLTFLIFKVIPNGDPADRMAGKNADAGAVAAIRRGLGLRQAALAAVPNTMKKVFTGDARSPTHSRSTSSTRSSDGLPAHARRSAIGAAIIWLVLGILVRAVSARCRPGGSPTAS